MKRGAEKVQFNQQASTAGCTLRLLLCTIPNGREQSQHGIRADAWFGSVRAANDAGLRGHEAVLQFKQQHSQFPKIEDELKASGGVHRYESLLVAYSIIGLTKNTGKIPTR